MKTRRSSLSATRAFSLVELLVVIALIGILTAIVVPKIQAVTTSAKWAKDQRNGQEVATVISMAVSAGAQNTALNTPAEAAIVMSSQGVTVPVASKPTVFQVPGLSPYDAYAASQFLVSGDHGATYSPTPQDPDYEANWESQKAAWMAKTQALAPGQVASL